MVAPHQPATPAPSARPIPTLVFVDAGLVRPPSRSVVDGMLRQVRRLRREGARFLPFEAFDDAARDGGAFEGVVLGFQDVGPGFLDHVWPVLREAGIAPVLFVHTAGVGHRPPRRAPGGEPRTLTWAELRQLSAAGVPVESAGHFGLDPGTVAGEVLFGDLVRSYRELEHHLGAAPQAVHVERGRARRPVCDLVRRAGYRYGFHDGATPPFASPWGLGAVPAGRWGRAGLPWGRRPERSTLLEELPGRDA